MPRTPAPFAVHPAVLHAQAILANLARTTGRDLEAWADAAAAAGPPDAKARREWLQTQGLGRVQAQFVAEHSLGLEGGSFAGSPERYLALAPTWLDLQYQGGRAALRPLCDALLDLARDLGPQVKVCPCETIVPLYRVHVFAQIKATTLTRIDLGLALGDPAAVSDPTGRLRDTGGFGKKDRITHRLEVRTAADLDADLRGWLRAAYERDGG